MGLIRMSMQVLRLFDGGMRRESGASHNPFLCQCSPSAQPVCQANLYGSNPGRSRVSLECVQVQGPENLGRPANVLPRPRVAVLGTTTLVRRPAEVTS